MNLIDRYEALDVGKYTLHKDIIFANHMNMNFWDFKAFIRGKFKNKSFRKTLFEELIELYEGIEKR